MDISSYKSPKDYFSTVTNKITDRSQLQNHKFESGPNNLFCMELTLSISVSITKKYYKDRCFKGEKKILHFLLTLVVLCTKKTSKI